MNQENSSQRRLPCFDPSRLTDIFEGDTLAIRGVLDESVCSLVKLHAELAAELRAHNREASISLVHEMKGVSANVGADELSGVSATILQLLRSAAGGLPKLPEEALQSALDRFIAAARSF